MAMHKRINNKERTAEQVLTVWREDDGFIGTYDDEGRRCGPDGKPETEVLLTTTGGASPLEASYQYVGLGSPFPVTSLPDNIELRQHQNGMEQIYEYESRLPWTLATVTSTPTRL